MTKDQQEKLEGRLDNWGRWNRARGSSPGRCGSIESRHVAERDPEATRIEHLTQAPIDNLDAEVIEAAVVALRIGRARELLRRVYVQRKDKLALARWLNVSPMLVQPAVIMAVGALQARVDRLPIETRDSVRMRRGLHPSDRSARVSALSNDVDQAPHCGADS